ncbi:pyroglutamyl-peptidase 1 isoform X2 [Ictalurus furcatus]|uniref:pyroglutamyl-peptidase 1 isoform X2 n=1 Tax=Ictalurus furcatus TaxID=66913 RepID=UPI002350F743|nr:pyroglutamyl-peptidase 1 isoform X2 [Ictalurus furcatus]
MDSCKPELIVVTGFGPFRQYLVNPSWEAVKGLKRMGFGANIEIHTVEIPVCYSKAQQAIVEIWHNLKPKVAIHVGIASGTKSIILEQTGKNTGYKDRDVRGICPADNCCIQGGAEHLDSIIDMRSISKRLKELGLDVIYSRDAGRFVLYCGVLINCTIVMYSCQFLMKEQNTMTTEVQMCVSSVCRYLCDFLHYLSLHYGQRRAALIHVPACGSLASPGKLVPQLQTIIQVMLCQLDTQRI